MTEYLLEVADLDVRYRGVPAVRGVSFNVGAAEAVGLIGPNGAGKSSTLAALMGATKASRGSVRLHGTEVLGMGPEQIVRRGLALVPEGRHIFGDLSVDDNLRLGMVGRRDRNGSADDLAQVRDLFPVLADFGHRKAGLLSGGQQQQLAIARALLARPDVLMLDEPSLGLSPSAVDTVFGALAKVRETGVAVLVVEQRAEFTVAFCHRTHVLHDGAITMRLSPADAENDALLTKAYFG